MNHCSVLSGSSLIHSLILFYSPDKPLSWCWINLTLHHIHNLQAPILESYLQTAFNKVMKKYLYSRLLQWGVDPSVCQWVVDFQANNRQFVQMECTIPHTPCSYQAFFLSSWANLHTTQLLWAYNIISSNDDPEYKRSGPSGFVLNWKPS